MKKVALIIGKQGFRDEEYFHPKEVLERNNIQVVTVSSIRGKCIGKLGGIANSDMTIDEIKVSDFDAIFFIGGPGAAEYFDSPVAHKILNEIALTDKIFGAICIAPTTLANAGVLKGKKSTGFPDAEEAVINGGGIWTAKNVEVDGNLITANGPQSAYEFGEMIVEKLK